jgi:hypothetical protein
MLNGFWGELGEATGAGKSANWVLYSEGSDLVVYPNRDTLSCVALVSTFL